MENKFTEIQRRWLEALESGSYEQAEGEFCKNGKFCCLGVATHVLNPEHEALEHNGWADPVHKHARTATAPPDVQAAFHFRDHCGRFPGLFHDPIVNWETDTLVELNDNIRLTFLEIAAFIRKNPEQVFTNFDADEANQ